MNTETRPISEISRRATNILFREMGIVETIRFFNQFSTGRGDYTKDREKWIGNVSLDEAISQIEGRRTSGMGYPGRPRDIRDIHK